MGDYEAEVQALDEGALVRALPAWGTLVVTGADRATWLAGMLTSDLVSLAPGQASYGLSVNKTGKVQSDVWVLFADDRALLGVPAEMATSLRDALDHYLIMEDAEIELAKEHWSWWLAHGPEASAVAEAARGAGALAGMATLGRCPTAVVAAPPNADRNLGELLTAPDGCLLATPASWERIRIERLVPAFGIDFETDVYPQEARLEDFAVSFQKGCYLGQEAVFMLQKRGKPPRRLVPVVIEGSEAITPGAVVDSEGGAAGRITSAVTTGNEVRALAFLKHKRSEVGAEITVDGRRGRVVEPVPGFH